MPFKLPEEFRSKHFPYCSHGGIFIIPHIGDMRMLKVIASDGGELNPIWEHVSVSLNTKKITSKTPNWYEMCYVKSLFWEDEDIVIQFHVPSNKAINIHPGCLHLWRCPGKEMILPPDILV